jgi:hypothetical protein
MPTPSLPALNAIAATLAVGLNCMAAASAQTSGQKNGVGRIVGNIEGISQGR